MSTHISPSSPALRSRALVTAKFLASISAAAGITSFWVKSIAVLAICRCSSERSSGVNTSCGSSNSVRKLPPLTRFAIACTLLVAIFCLLTSVFFFNSDSRRFPRRPCRPPRSEEHTSELQSLRHLVCRLLLEKKKKTHQHHPSESPPHSLQPTHTPPCPS